MRRLLGIQQNPVHLGTSYNPHGFLKSKGFLGRLLGIQRLPSVFQELLTILLRILKSKGFWRRLLEIQRLPSVFQELPTILPRILKSKGFWGDCWECREHPNVPGRAFGKRENPSFHKSWLEASPFTGEGFSLSVKGLAPGAFGQTKKLLRTRCGK